MIDVFIDSSCWALPLNVEYKTIEHDYWSLCVSLLCVHVWIRR